MIAPFLALAALPDRVLLAAGLGSAVLVALLYFALSFRRRSLRASGPPDDPPPEAPRCFVLGPCPACGNAVLRELDSGFSFTTLRTGADGGLYRVPHACPTGRRVALESYPVRWPEGRKGGRR